MLNKRPIKIIDVKEKARKELEAGKKVTEDVVILGGIIEEARTIKTKKNDDMCFIRLADLTGSIEAVVFPRAYGQWKSIIVPDKCVALKAKVSERNGEISLVVESFMALQ